MTNLGSQSEKGRRIATICNEIVAQRSSGGSVSRHQLQSKYPELMPELERTVCESLLNEELDFFNSVTDDYQLIELIHRGGQGAVYSAMQVSTGRPVAVKMLAHAFFSSPSDKQQLFSEIDVLSRLEHPNIIPMYDCGEVAGIPYIVMKFVPGLTIVEYCDTYNPSLSQRVMMLQKILFAIQFAHDSGITHRDIKPSNMIVDAGERPYLIDFGLAKEELDVAESVRLGQPDEVVGTLPYWSPEQAIGGSVDLRADVYGLGVVAFNVLTQKMPYEITSNIAQMMMRIAVEEPRRVRDCLPEQNKYGLSKSDISRDLEAVISKSLGKSANNRYQTALEFAEDLGRAINGKPVRAAKITFARGAKRVVRKYRVLAAVLICISICTIVLSLVSSHNALVLNRKAQVYAASLAMGAMDKLSSSHRDKGKLNDASIGFQSAIDMARNLDEEDVHAKDFLFKAHHQLAKIELGRGHFRAAKENANKASLIASESMLSGPDSPKSIRQHAFASQLQGKLLMAREKWEEAAEKLEVSCWDLGYLRKLAPGDAGVTLEEGWVTRMLGKCYKKMGQREAALAEYRKSVQLCRVAQEALGNEDGVLQLALSFNSLGQTLAESNQPELMVQGEDYFREAENVLDSLDEDAIIQLSDYRTTRSAITKNLRIIRRRLAKRQGSRSISGSTNSSSSSASGSDSASRLNR